MALWHSAGAAKGSDILPCRVGPWGGGAEVPRSGTDVVRQPRLKVADVSKARSCNRLAWHLKEQKSSNCTARASARPTSPGVCRSAGERCSSLLQVASQGSGN
jgi:hypothetical protein